MGSYCLSLDAYGEGPLSSLSLCVCIDERLFMSDECLFRHKWGKEREMSIVKMCRDG